jgi:hypothetical protein
MPTHLMRTAPLVQLSVHLWLELLLGGSRYRNIPLTFDISVTRAIFPDPAPLNNAPNIRTKSAAL